LIHAEHCGDYANGMTFKHTGSARLHFHKRTVRSCAAESRWRPSALNNTPYCIIVPAVPAENAEALSGFHFPKPYVREQEMA
jgi:hypothetical protein